jgi:hypothetical protein
MANNKVIYDGTTLIDLTSDTVTPDTLLTGATAHDASGAQITGTATGGGDLSDITTNITGLLKGAGGKVTQAEGGTDYAAPATDTVVTASASAWSNNTITLSVTGVMADSKLEIGLSDTATDEQYAAATAAQIRATGSGNGTVTLKATTAPTIDLPIIIRRLS